MNEEYVKLLKEMEKDEHQAPGAYQKLIDLAHNTSEKKLLRLSQRDERKHHMRLFKILKKEMKR